VTKILENRHDRATAAATAPITGLAILEPADAGTATAATAAERSTRQETVTATYMGSHHGGIVLPLTIIGIAAGTELYSEEVNATGSVKDAIHAEAGGLTRFSIALAGSDDATVGAAATEVNASLAQLRGVCNF
jgi:hypothetical protein